ncbi:hypothetical protein [Streptomyces sp. NPDC023838]
MARETTVPTAISADVIGIIIGAVAGITPQVLALARGLGVA